MSYSPVITPEQLIGKLGVGVEERAPSRMGNAHAKFVHPGKGCIGSQTVLVSKKLPDHLRTWALFHEAAHIRDSMMLNRAGQWVGYNGLAGIGRLSSLIHKELRSAESFILTLRPKELEAGTPLWRFKHLPGRLLTEEEVFGSEEISPRMKSKVRLRIFNSRVKTSRYRSQLIELFADAVACAFVDPARLESGAPGLLEAIGRVARPEGYPIPALADIGLSSQ